MTTDVYLDYNATTPVDTRVAEAMWPYLTERFGNPSSASVEGRLAREAVDHARERVGALIDADASEVIFTSGGTESNNLAILGGAEHAHYRVAVTSPIEHPATTAPLQHLRERRGWLLRELPVDAHARISVSDLAGVPTDGVGLGSIILAHNEVGTIQPVAAFAEAVKSAGGLAHTDAAQAVGKIPVSARELGVDLLTIAGHKLHAPKGTGALYLRSGVRLSPVLLGAGQERGIRPGTENVAGIVGLGAAADLARRSLSVEAHRQEGLRERLWAKLHRSAAGIRRLTPAAGALPNTLLVSVPGLLGADILTATVGVAASTGSACHSGEHRPSATLTAMGLEARTALGALRLSLGRGTSAAEIDRAAAALASGIAAASGFDAAGGFVAGGRPSSA